MHGGFFGRGRGALHSRRVLVPVLKRGASGKREESSSGEAGENKCFHDRIVIKSLLGGRCGRGLLFFGGRRRGWINDGCVVLHLLFLLCRRVNDRRVFLDDLLRRRGADARIASDEEASRSRDDDNGFHG